MRFLVATCAPDGPGGVESVRVLSVSYIVSMCVNSDERGMVVSVREPGYLHPERIYALQWSFVDGAKLEDALHSHLARQKRSREEATDGTTSPQ